MILLTKYDAYDTEYEEDDCLIVEEDLHDILYNMFSNHPHVIFEGNLGLWDGPHHVKAEVNKMDTAFNMITDQDVFEVWYVDKEQDISELQRYSEQWSMHINTGCVLVKQWHHDGCNLITIKPSDAEAFTPEDVGL